MNATCPECGAEWELSGVEQGEIVVYGPNIMQGYLFHGSDGLAGWLLVARFGFALFVVFLARSRLRRRLLRGSGIRSSFRRLGLHHWLGLHFHHRRRRRVLALHSRDAGA